jgi:hypothetical protein
MAVVQPTPRPDGSPLTVGWFVAHDPKPPVWELFGIADLVVAITMGAMTSPGPAHLLAFETPNLLISSYPLVMVPAFAVPLALMLHGLVLWRLRRGAASAPSGWQRPDASQAPLFGRGFLLPKVTSRRSERF